MIPAVRSCFNCAFSEVATAPGGQVDFSLRVCKKNPPTPLGIMTQQGFRLVDSAFPIVNRDTWCHSGEPMEGAVEEESKPS